MYFVCDSDGNAVSSPLTNLQRALDLQDTLEAAQVLRACEICEDKPASRSSDLGICFDCQIRHGEDF
jgi:uncharacterized membrane protein